MGVVEALLPADTPVEAGAEAESPGVASRLKRAPLTVAAVALLPFVLYLCLFFAQGRDIRVLIHADRAIFERSHASTIIRPTKDFPYSWSYDGRFWYFIAIDPLNARYYVDQPDYRYTKILYPMTARLLALGQADLVPYTMVLINILAIAGGVFVLAAWLRRRGASPWLALLYAVYTGTFYSFTTNLVEPLSYLLMLLGIYQYDFGGRRRVLWAGIFFSLAVLARDKALLFAAIYGAAFLLSGVVKGRTIDRQQLMRNLPRSVLYGALTLVPFLAYKVFLHLWLGGGSEQSAGGVAVPLVGVAHASVSMTRMVSQGSAIVIPALIAGLVGLWALIRGYWRAEVVLLVVSAAVIFALNPVYYAPDYYGVMRVGMAMVIAAILCVPTVDRILRNRLWLAACAIGWCTWTWVMYVRP